MYGPRSIPARFRESEAKAKLNVWKLKCECVRRLRSGRDSRSGGSVLHSRVFIGVSPSSFSKIRSANEEILL